MFSDEELRLIRETAKFCFPDGVRPPIIKNIIDKVDDHFTYQDSED